MYILGIAPHAYSSAALLKSGKLVAAAAEERFTRVKQQSGWPVNAITYVLNEAGISLREVDYFAFPNLPPTKFYMRQLRDFYFSGLFKYYGTRTNLSLLFKIPKKLHDNFEAIHIKRMGYQYRPEQIFHIEHHIAHASAAYFCSPFNNRRAGILTIDGEGDFVTIMISVGNKGRIEVKERIKTPHSLGRLYEAFSNYLGYPGPGHEEKVMGLASYGSPNKNFKDIISFKGDFFKINPRYSIAHNAAKNLQEKFGPANISLEKDFKNIDKKYIDIAATLQDKLEQAALKLLRYMVRKYKIDALCVGGGSALNVIMNGKLLQSGLIKDFYSQPASNDTGNSLGAALETWARLGHRPNFVMDHVYWGPGYSNEEIEKLLKEYKLKYKKENNIEKETAKLLRRGNIIGWFQGRMEWGPRALGNRSILVDPRSRKNMDEINNHVKFRENWRPFCPSMLAEVQDEYLVGSYWSPFMNIGFDVKKNKQKEIAAVVHVDGTARPQTVEKDKNPRYWKLIKEFEKLTGVGVLLNTSFNVKGEPIVCSPRDAIRCFFATGMDYLAIGNFIVSKK